MSLILPLWYPETTPIILGGFNTLQSLPLRSIFSSLSLNGWTHPTALTAAWPYHLMELHESSQDAVAPFGSLPLTATLTWLLSPHRAEAAFFCYRYPHLLQGSLAETQEGLSTTIRNKWILLLRQIILLIFIRRRLWAEYFLSLFSVRNPNHPGRGQDKQLLQLFSHYQKNGRATISPGPFLSE